MTLITFALLIVGTVVSFFLGSAFSQMLWRRKIFSRQPFFIMPKTGPDPVEPVGDWVAMPTSELVDNLQLLLASLKVSKTPSQDNIENMETIANRVMSREVAAHMSGAKTKAMRA